MIHFVPKCLGALCPSMSGLMNKHIVKHIVIGAMFHFWCPVPVHVRTNTRNSSLLLSWLVCWLVDGKFAYLTGVLNWLSTVLELESNWSLNGFLATPAEEQAVRFLTTLLSEHVSTMNFIFCTKRRVETTVFEPVCYRNTASPSGLFGWLVDWLIDWLVDWFYTSNSWTFSHR